MTVWTEALCSISTPAVNHVELAVHGLDGLPARHAGDDLERVAASRAAQAAAGPQTARRQLDPDEGQDDVSAGAQPAIRLAHVCGDLDARRRLRPNCRGDPPFRRRPGDQYLTAGLFGDSLWAWGIWDLCLAALALFAGWSLLSGGGFGRVVGYVWGVAVVVQGFLIIEQAPWYGAGAITVAVLVIYGLATTAGWRAEEVSP